jgi:hypothetical protein
LAAAQPSYRATTANPVTGGVKCLRQNCGRINPAANTFCYYCGALLGEWVKIIPEPRTSPPAPPVRARLKLPGNSEISLATEAIWLGRDDLKGLVPEHNLKYISMQHLIIRFENGDHIEVADVITLTFKVT